MASPSHPQSVAKPSATGPGDSIRMILCPRSVAVVGAGRDPETMSGKLFRNLLESFTGKLYAVNPNAKAIQGMCSYASVLDLPEQVDLAIVAVPAACVPSVVRQCVQRGIPGLVVISAGFSEIGQAAGELDLLEILRRSETRMVGPNCVGVLNTDPAIRLNGTFSPFFPLRGKVAICTQSGALGVVIPDYARRERIGLSSLVSVGNKADLGENDLLRYWENDPATNVISLYLESFQDPRALLPLARRISRHKPIVALKVGRTAAGSRAAGSHTAALASPSAATEALFRQTGIIRARSLTEWFDVTALLACQPLPSGQRVAVLTNAGGPGVLCADALEAEGLSVPELSSDLQASLRRLLRPEASVRNPIDLIGTVDAGEYRECLRRLLESDEVDSVIVIYVPRIEATSGPILEAVQETAAGCQRNKSLLGVLMETADVPTIQSDAPQVPLYRFPEAAAATLAQATHYGEWRRGIEGRVGAFTDLRVDEARQTVERAIDRLAPAGGWLTPSEALDVVSAFGIRVPRCEMVFDAEQAVAAAKRIGGPVVVKVVSLRALHKSDIGGVVLDVHGDNAVRSAFTQVTLAAPDATGALIQEFVRGGYETLVGVTHDPAFGHLIGFGLGGVLVELLDDVAFRLHPLTDHDTHEMVREIRGARILNGYRHRSAADITAIEETLLRVSALVAELHELVELDLNPLMVLEAGHGVCALDVRMRVRPTSAVECG